MKRLISTILAVVMLCTMAVPAWAATSQDVLVTAAPAYVSVTNAPSTWTLNGLTGSGKIAPDTIYYANPGGDTVAPSATVIDGECNFTLTDGSSVSIDIYVNCDDFSGGDANMTNSNLGTNGATEYGAYSWYSGMTYSGKVIMKSSASSVLKSSHTGNIKWGAEIETQTNDWAGGSSSSANMTISVQAS